MTKEFGFQYSGILYRSIGDFLGENYLEYGFTKGTVQEVDFLIDLLDLPTGARILDVGCGPGRHSLELARRGFRTVGVDISKRFVEIASQTSRAEHLTAEFHVHDAKLMQFRTEFDAVICLCEGAFGLAGSDEAHKQVLRNIFNALKPGGWFVLTAINSYSVVQQKPSPELFDAYTGTSREIETIHSPEDEWRDVMICTTTFTFRELKLLSEYCGFQVDAGYGCTAGQFERRPLTINDVEIMLVARKP